MASNRKRTETGDENVLAETIGLYALGKISFGKAAERAGMSRWEMQETPRESRCRGASRPTERGGIKSRGRNCARSLIDSILGITAERNRAADSRRLQAVADELLAR